MKAHTIFTGCARPAMFLGVPLMVLVLSGLSTLFVSGALVIFWTAWAALPVLIGFLIFFLWARSITKIDEWRLYQVLQKLKVRRSNGNLIHHGGVSYAPYKLRKR